MTRTGSSSGCRKCVGGLEEGCPVWELAGSGHLPRGRHRSVHGVTRSAPPAPRHPQELVDEAERIAKETLEAEDM